MTDKWPGHGGQSGHLYEQKTLLQRYKSTTAGDLNQLYSLFFLLYWLFHMSDQLWASCNLDLWTAGVCSTNLHDSLSPVIKKTPCMAATTAQSVLIDTYHTHYFTIISIICTNIRIISNLEIQIWVHIHCRKLANRHIHNWGSVSKQNHEQEGLKYQSITNCPWPTAILPEADPFG